MFLLTGWFADASDKERLQALISKAQKQGCMFPTQALFCTNKLVMQLFLNCAKHWLQIETLCPGSYPPSRYVHLLLVLFVDLLPKIIYFHSKYIII